MSTSWFAVVASGVFLARLVPQPVRLARRGVAAGVSPLAALNAVVATLGWLAYGLVVGLPVVWIVAALALVPGLWTVALLAGSTRREDLMVAGGWAAVVVLSFGVGLAAGVLAVGVLVTQGPQVWLAARERDLSGIAPATWWLAIADATSWGAYGVAVADPALMGYGLVLSASASVVLARLWWTRRAVLAPAVAV